MHPWDKGYKAQPLDEELYSVPQVLASRDELHPGDPAWNIGYYLPPAGVKKCPKCPRPLDVSAFYEYGNGKLSGYCKVHHGSSNSSSRS